MLPRVFNAYAKENFIVEIEFKNKEKGKFDVKPYLEYDVFKPLKNPVLFKQIKVINGTLVWNDEIDIDPDTVYLDTVKD